MRLAPVPIYYHNNLKRGMEVAALQSFVTHNGLEAAECCRLITLIIIELINYEGSDPKKEILDKIGDKF